MFRRGDPDAFACAAAESAAFDGTAMEWQPGAEALCGEARSFMESMWWVSTFGARRCGVEPVQRPTAQPSNEYFALDGAVIEIRLHPQATRYSVFSLLARAAVTITRTREPSHGHAWRSWYVQMIRAAYGPEWAQRLADAFDDAGLSYTAAT